MSLEDSKALVRRYQEAFNNNKLDELDKIVARDIVSHNHTPGAPQGLEGSKMVHKMLMVAFPDNRVTIDDLIAEGDKVVARWTSTGTHQGEFMGMPPTGKKFTGTGISIFRIANGKIVEHWATQSSLEIMQQLGLVPTPGQPRKA